MRNFILHRLLAAIIVLIGVSVIVFLALAAIPGDAATAILGSFATPDNKARLTASLGLDKPLPVQYLSWLSNVLKGDFGRSYALDRPVLDEVLDRLGPTLILAAAALCLCSVIGLLLGAVAAVRHRSWIDRLITLAVLIGISTPSFFLGIVLILIFAVTLRWFPTGGMYALFGGGDLLDLLHHLVLPALTLALVAAAIIARLTRTSMLEIIRQDHVRTARAKGLREPRIMIVHAFRNGLVDIIPVIGLQAGYVLGGAVYVETIFQWPGIGRMLVDAIMQRDVLLVQGGVLIVATGFVIFNLAADIIQRLVDPRIGSGR
ncbi:ABC transporter permease [Arboricoccus pini]|uniref:ABC transporter permease n=1 Tax=Arboricoccus pini TaxID=1963835 RepID=UPI000B50BCB0|nr:ABC transporter permease [Arboricoccus pini]